MIEFHTVAEIALPILVPLTPFRVSSIALQISTSIFVDARRLPSHCLLTPSPHDRFYFSSTNVCHEKRGIQRIMCATWYDGLFRMFRCVHCVIGRERMGDRKLFFKLISPKFSRSLSLLHESEYLSQEKHSRTRLSRNSPALQRSRVPISPDNRESLP